MLAGFCGWAVRLDAPARWNRLCRKTRVSENLLWAGALGHVFARTTSDLLRSRKSFGNRHSQDFVVGIRYRTSEEGGGSVLTAASVGQHADSPKGLMLAVPNGDVFTSGGVGALW